MRATNRTLLTLLLGISIAAPARAGHHSWDFTEIFSNADGTVQFIEMIVTGASNEQNVGGWTITAGANIYTFPTNLPSPTALNDAMLVATAAFAALPGAPAPDYVLPDNFFATGGGTLNYAGGADIWSYGAVPTDGVLSLARDGSTPTNSPTNFAGVTGSVDLSGPSLPSASGWALILLVGAILFSASGLLRRQPTTA